LLRLILKLWTHPKNWSCDVHPINIIYRYITIQHFTTSNIIKSAIAAPTRPVGIARHIIVIVGCFLSKGRLSCWSFHCLRLGFQGLYGPLRPTFRLLVGRLLATIEGLFVSGWPSDHSGSSALWFPRSTWPSIGSFYSHSSSGPHPFPQ